VGRLGAGLLQQKGQCVQRLGVQEAFNSFEELKAGESMWKSG
jgi:hypothetical protein